MVYCIIFAVTIILSLIFMILFSQESTKMSWAADEWKDGLPPAALQKITQLETQFGKLKKERDQKQCQLESLEVVSPLLFLKKFFRSEFSFRC